jgi:hypothetical protein
MTEQFNYEQRNTLYQFLIDKFNVIKIHENYDENNFGNFSIILAADSFLINYVNDRSFLSIEIASKVEESNWYPLSYIKNFLCEQKNINEVESSDNQSRINELNNFLQQNIFIISEMMNKDNYYSTKKRLNKFLKEQFDRNFGK